MSMFDRGTARRFHREPAPFTVSRTKRMHPLWRYLWPYRSANHFILAMFSAIAVWAIHGMFLSHYIPGYFNPISLLVLLVFVPVMIPFDELPAKVTITPHVPAHRLMREIEEELAVRGYALQASASHQPGHLHFCPQDKVEFRPMVWIEQDMDVCLRDDATIDVYGSKVDLSKLVHCLKRRYNKPQRALA